VRIVNKKQVEKFEKLAVWPEMKVHIMLGSTKVWQEKKVWH
jgi:hypothetical protein